MSRGKRYEERKLNLKKVFAVILAIIVIIMSVWIIRGILSKEGSSRGITSKTYFAAYQDNKWGVIDENGEFVIDAIMEADAVIIGPGSLYTNVIPNLLVKGVAKAIKETKAFKIYVSNLMTEPGQTDNYTLSEHIKAINEHVGKGVIEYCIYDTGEIVPEYIRKYNMEGSELVEQDTSKVKIDGVYLIQRNLSYIENGFIRHNPDAIAAPIIQLICDDLKFSNMENNTQYMMLNNKLKDSKKSLKKQAKDNKKKISEKKNEDKEKQRKSKFFKKYSERIESIQESDLKQKKKEELRSKRK